MRKSKPVTKIIFTVDYDQQNPDATLRRSLGKDGGLCDEAKVPFMIRTYKCATQLKFKKELMPGT